MAIQLGRSPSQLLMPLAFAASAALWAGGELIYEIAYADMPDLDQKRTVGQDPATVLGYLIKEK